MYNLCRLVLVVLSIICGVGIALDSVPDGTIPELGYFVAENDVLYITLDKAVVFMF
jgi:hypothetical protein